MTIGNAAEFAMESRIRAMERKCKRCNYLRGVSRLKKKHTFPVQRFALQRAATEKLKRGNLCLRYDEIEVSQGLILLHREPRCGCSEMQHLLRLVT